MASTSKLNSSDLVKSLYNFGLEDITTKNKLNESLKKTKEEEKLDDLDEEEEEIIVGGIKGESKVNKEEEIKNVKIDLKGKGKAKQLKSNKNNIKSIPISKELESLSISNKSITEPKLNKSLKGLLRSTIHTIKLTDPTDSNKTIERVLTSWKMADYAYKRDPCPFPTRARGLFTEKVNSKVVKNDEDEVKVEKKEEEEYKIIARGYDKFFNIAEVSWTHWKTIPDYSTGPYELTLKSNGCIILIAALSSNQILVTSKHSIGSNMNVTTTGGISHSERGEYWLELHLKKVNKTKEDLAKKLWEENWTAVAELCDDTFEEHVLPYPPALTGLHLHGINLNTPLLYSLPSSTVTSIALEFGFLPTPYQIFNSVEEVKSYCDEVQKVGGIYEETGEEVGEGGGKEKKLIPVEGFVVRGIKKGGEMGEPFFWKVKFDEPYLMYREWRELTRKLLGEAYKKLAKEEEEKRLKLENGSKNAVVVEEEKEEDVSSEIKLAKVRNQESRLYVFWVNREINQNLSKFDSWKVGKGIINIREEFLQWRTTEEGKLEGIRLGSKFVEDELEKERLEQEGVDGSTINFDKTLIVPIAVQGCGKTTLGLELNYLFNFGHIQSDDILVKKAGPPFIKKVKELLQSHQVVFADKNNHVKKLRSDLVDATTSLNPRHRVRLIALIWNLDSPSLPRDKVHSICASRIVTRGQNHQTLRAGEGHESAIWQFFSQYEEFDSILDEKESKFHNVFEMRLEWNQKETLCKTIDYLVEVVGLERPDEVKIEEAIQFANNYKTTIKKEISSSKLAKTLAPRYYGIQVEQDLNLLLSPYFNTTEENKNPLYSHLILAKRIELNPHITLVHEVELTNSDKEFSNKKQLLWNSISTLVNLNITEPSELNLKNLEVEIELGPKIFWDKRVMSIQVSKITSLSTSTTNDSNNNNFNYLEEGKGSAHVTVGTIESSIRPIEGKLILKAWEEGKKITVDGGKINFLDIGIIKCKGKIMGMK